MAEPTSLFQGLSRWGVPVMQSASCFEMTRSWLTMKASPPVVDMDLRADTAIAAPPLTGLERNIVEHAFARAAGAPLVAGNDVRVLLDAGENFPAWLAAIRGARRTVLFENYIIDADEVGFAFADALSERARAGVKVRLIRDWYGSHGLASRRFWRSLEGAGVEVRVFNPPRLDSPFGWLSRDHRKMIAVDEDLAFVSGLCISRRWMGDPARNIAPWRDTGVAIRGPAVAYVQRGFADVWNETGARYPLEEIPDPTSIPRAGDVAVRVVAGEPTSSEVFRVDQLIAAAAQRTLWITDAYFVGVAPYVQALRAAARDGVDVRLLVPSTSDLPLLSSFSRTGYRLLLEAGIRIFEWNGPMLHAKTAVADGRWARIGSSNLNLASLVGNYELDAAIEDERIGQLMEEIYLRDLSESTEITLPARRATPVPVEPRRSAGGRGSRSPLGAVRFANAVGTAAAAGTRALGAVDHGLTLAIGFVLFALAAVAVLWPPVVGYPLAVIATWLGVTLLMRARRIVKQKQLDR
jgi:cardiolipin synthase